MQGSKEVRKEANAKAKAIKHKIRKKCSKQNWKKDTVIPSHFHITSKYCKSNELNTMRCTRVSPNQWACMGAWRPWSPWPKLKQKCDHKHWAQHELVMNWCWVHGSVWNAARLGCSFMLMGLTQGISDATQLVQVYCQWLSVHLVEQVAISLTTITLAQNFVSIRKRTKENAEDRDLLETKTKGLLSHM